ncbi:hypothetical protein BDQ12DRAFT_615335 [Crucibulum laeve]|uniref:Large ribosomal subunit protein bL33m n=1 Tax=Crucibulum laeve TaxID=68775 RepID=A0A5C3LN57_9AGAR|nr:hypothetical protein BDQ12DRAFT_615335 [Crucibulum laeve]
MSLSHLSQIANFHARRSTVARSLSRWPRKLKLGACFPYSSRCPVHRLINLHAYRTLIVRLISTAQTGFFYTTQRVRQGPKLRAVKYDPPYCEIVKQRVLFVESKKTKK